MEQWLVTQDKRITLNDFHLSTKKIVQGLFELGVGHGDSVALLLRNGIEFLEVTYAAGLLGAYPVPINWHFKESEIVYILLNSDAKLIVAHTDLATKIPLILENKIPLILVEPSLELQTAYKLKSRSLPPHSTSQIWNTWKKDLRPWPNQPQASRGSMIYTSGTTGKPKGVRRTPATPKQQNTMIAHLRIGFGLRPGAKALLTGPLYHSAPNAYARAVISLGGDLILMPRFNAREFLHIIEKHSITHAHMVPTMFVRLLQLSEVQKNEYDLTSLENIVHCAAPCAAQIKRKMIDWLGPIINEYYGSTEAGLISYVTSDEWLSKVGTVGRPIENCSIQIHDEHGEPVGPRKIGDIFVSSGQGNKFTYYKDEAKREEISRNGLITNGDRGYLDKDNYLFLCDRKSDMIISGGVNIYPAEIEAVLIDLKGVQDCAIFGVPESEYGEAIVAAIQAEPGTCLGPEDVKSFIRKNMANFKVPKFVTFHDKLPREDSGKIYKRKLRESYLKR